MARQRPRRRRGRGRPRKLSSKKQSPAPASQKKPPLPSESPVPMETEVACVCGQLLRLTSAFTGRRAKCPRCARRFIITTEKDPSTGEDVPTPFYVSDAGPSTGETQELPAVSDSLAVVAPEETADTGMIPLEGETKPASETHIHSDADLEIIPELLPDPPHAVYFECPCGKKLLARKNMYDRRVRCPHCNGRLLLSIVFDDVERRHEIRPVRLEDDSTGDTADLR